LLAGTMARLVFATPVLMLFSPVLVPIMLTIGVVVMGGTHNSLWTLTTPFGIVLHACA
jgi:hypothetical protein